MLERKSLRFWMGGSCWAKTTQPVSSRVRICPLMSLKISLSGVRAFPAKCKLVFKSSFLVRDVPGLRLMAFGGPFEVTSGHDFGVSGLEGKSHAQFCSKACDLNILSLSSS